MFNVTYLVEVKSIKKHVETTNCYLIVINAFIT